MAKNNLGKFYVMIDALVFKLTNIIAKGGTLIFLIWPMTHVMAVTIPPTLEGSSCYPSVCLTVAVIQPGN